MNFRIGNWTEKKRYRVCRRVQDDTQRPCLPKQPSNTCCKFGRYSFTKSTEAYLEEHDVKNDQHMQMLFVKYIYKDEYFVTFKNNF